VACTVGINDTDVISVPVSPGHEGIGCHAR
jgi:hypothetical protein